MMNLGGLSNIFHDRVRVLNLDRLEWWTETNKEEFDKNKYKIPHIGLKIGYRNLDSESSISTEANDEAYIRKK